MHFVHKSVNIVFIFMQLTINKPTSRSNQSLDCGIFHHQKSNHVCSTQAWGLNLNPHNTLILWQGYSGMKLQDLVPKLITLLRIEHGPQFLIIHCGGNNVGQTTTEKFLFSTLPHICATFPTTTVIWSSSLPRFTCRFSTMLRQWKPLGLE